MPKLSLGILSKGQVHSFAAGQNPSGRIEATFITSPTSKPTDTTNLQVILDDGRTIKKQLKYQYISFLGFSTAKVLKNLALYLENYSSGT